MTAGSSFRVYRKWMMGAWPLPSLSWLLARIIWQRRQSGQLVLGCLSPAQSQVQRNLSPTDHDGNNICACVPPDLQIPVRSAFLHEMSHQTLIWGYCAVLSCWTLTHRRSDGRNHSSLCLTPNISVQMIASIGRWRGRWPCLLYSTTSVGRGLKKKPWHCSKRVGDVGPDVMVYVTCAVIGLGGRGVIKNTDWSWSGCKSAPLHADVRSHLSGSSAIQPLASSEESWHRIYFL